MDGLAERGSAFFLRLLGNGSPARLRLFEKDCKNVLKKKRTSPRPDTREAGVTLTPAGWGPVSSSGGRALAVSPVFVTPSTGFFFGGEN